MSQQTCERATAWLCPHCGAQNTTTHDPAFRHMVVSCDIERGGCGRTVIVDVELATARRAIKTLDVAPEPLVDVDLEFVYPPGAERVRAADERHSELDARLAVVESDVALVMRRFKVTQWEKEGR